MRLMKWNTSSGTPRRGSPIADSRYAIDAECPVGAGARPKLRHPTLYCTGPPPAASVDYEMEGGIESRSRFPNRLSWWPRQAGKRSRRGLRIRRPATLCEIALRRWEDTLM